MKGQRMVSFFLTAPAYFAAHELSFSYIMTVKNISSSARWNQVSDKYVNQALRGAFSIRQEFFTFALILFHI